MFGDLENYNSIGGSEGSEGMSEAAMEAFREQMRSASQQLKALQKGEQKRKKKEEKLAKLLAQFLQRKSGKTDLAFQAAHLLALNIPAAFVLSMLLLGDRESQQELTMAAKEDDKGLEVEVLSSDTQQRITLGEEDLALIRTEDEEKSQAIIDEILVWIDIMYIQARNDVMRMMKNAYDEDQKIHDEIPQFMTTVVTYFMTENGMSVPPENVEKISETMLQKIFTALNENLEKIQALRSKEFES